MVLDNSTTLTDGQRQRISALADSESADSGRRPLGETSRAALAADGGAARHWLWHDPELQAYACESPGSPPTVELTADPANPAAAHALLQGLMESLGEASLWTHGDRSQGRLAAALTGLGISRELLLLSRALPAPDVDARPLPAGVTIRTFDAPRDSAAWVELNHDVFADLPDQGEMTEDDLRAKVAAEWFDPAGFLVAERDGELVGYHWTKRDPGTRTSAGASGEVYVLGVRDDMRGSGLAMALLKAGLDLLTATGLVQVHLFVESSNEAARGLYERAGFAVIDTDRQYVWDRP